MKDPVAGRLYCNLHCSVSIAVRCRVQCTEIATRSATYPLQCDERSSAETLQLEVLPYFVEVVPSIETKGNKHCIWKRSLISLR